MSIDILRRLIACKKFKTLTEANKFFELNRHYLSGGKQLTIYKFKEIINYLKEYNKWRNKNLIYTRKNGEWGSFHNMGADCILQIHTLGGWENNIPKSVKIKPNPLWD